MTEKGRTTTLRLGNGGKTVARDLSESLGKLPPQALEMEESVLGACLLEKNALDQVISFLKPDHFYVEAHREIFTAILGLKADSEPIDMRTVVNRLKKTAKIELVGGQYRIMELSNAVSSSAHIESHARVIVEMSVKRELIQIASKIHHDAYEDTTDAWKLLEKAFNELDFFQKNATPENNADKIKGLWEKTLVTERPPYVPPLLTINDVTVATQGNHSLLVGKKKSRKTLLIVFLITEYLKQYPDNASKILLFDTEQGREDVFLMREKIFTITKLYVPIFYLRGQSPQDRKDFIRDTVLHWHQAPLLLVIDGIRDLMSNINDPDESTDLIVWLEKLTLQHNVHVINILHLNKTDNNARGHIGSELLNKAQTTIEVELDEKTNSSVVKCESSRGKPFETFSFSHDKDGLPVVLGTPMAGEIINADEKRKRLEMLFEDGPMKYKELVEEIKAHFGVGLNKAGHLLTEFQRHGWIVKNGKSRNSDTVYKLMSTVSTNGHTPEVIQTESPLENHVNTDDLPF